LFKLSLKLALILVTVIDFNINIDVSLNIHAKFGISVETSLEVNKTISGKRK
jgi:hypothetical protein